MERLAWGRQPPVWQEEELESTSLRLRELAEAGAEGGTVLLADRQTGGRGRQGRSFLPPEGGLYLSVLLRPDCGAEHCTELTALAAVAVQRAVKAVTGVFAGIKWPNDLLLGEKKLCGILTELRVDKEGRPQVILGIGLNLNTPPEAFSGELSRIACSLYGETGQQTDGRLMLERLLSGHISSVMPFSAALRKQSRNCSSEIRESRLP